MGTPLYDLETVSAGTEIFREGDSAGPAFVVKVGLVELDRVVKGTRTPFIRIGPGGIFGEMAVIDGGPRAASATALEETTLVLVSEEVFRTKLDTADPFIRGLVRLFVKSLRNSTPDKALGIATPEADTRPR